MKLEDRCSFNEAGELTVEPAAGERAEYFQYRWVNLKSPAGEEPRFMKSRWDEPIRNFPKLSVLEIKDGKETCVITPPGFRISVRYRSTGGRNGSELSFPEGSKGIDLSRVLLADRTGTRYSLGSGEILAGMRWLLPEGAEVGTNAGGWRLTADRYGEEAVDFKSN